MKFHLILLQVIAEVDKILINVTITQLKYFTRFKLYIVFDGRIYIQIVILHLYTILEIKLIEDKCAIEIYH